MENKRGDLLYTVIIHIVLIGFIFAMFTLAAGGQVNSRGVKQQVLEKQIALLIDSSDSGTTLTLEKVYLSGNVEKIILQGGKVYVSINGLSSANGYPYFSKYNVDLREEKDHWIINIK